MSHYHSSFHDNGLFQIVLSLRNLQYDDGVENAPGNLLSLKILTWQEKRRPVTALVCLSTRKMKKKM